MRIVSSLLVALCCATAFAVPASAAGVVEDRGTLRATVGGGQVLTFSSPVRRIAVAEEGLASVHLVSEREILLNGQRAGVTTLFIWLEDDRRVRYVLRVGPNIDFVSQALREIDPRISVETSPDGTSIILRGDVADARTARWAKHQAEILLRTGGNSGGVSYVLNLLRYPGVTASPEDRLAAALEVVDPRIRVRRIQVGLEADPERDSFVLEGNVRTIQDLQRAIALAERQLGGSGVNLVVADDERISFGRHQGVGIGGQGFGQLGGGLPAPGLANKLSRGLIVTSASGRVISFLEIDELAQIMVSIRVFEVDRGKARKMGINFRIDTEHVAIGNYVGPQSGALPSALGGRPNAGGFAGGFGGNVGSGVGGNLIVSFVDRATAILSAIDFLDSKSLVRAVAEPNILTLSGESASVLVGGEVPIPTATSNQVSNFQGVFFQNFGVRLDLRPTVDADGVVTLEVAPSIVRPDPSLGVGGVPGFQIQTVQTTARVAAGESLVLGGLLTFEEGEGQRGLPGLDKIPVFRWRNRTHREQELMFVITPRLMGISSDAAREAELGPLEWPEDRGQWIENLKPAEYGIDGVLPSFEASPEPAVVTPAPAPAQGSYYAPAPAPAAPLPAPAPVYSTPEPAAPEDSEPPASATLDAEPYEETSSPGDAFVSVESLPEAPPLGGASETSDARH